jgi:saccharopine dehydrogenase-like NADP-dependent oxidoreductase
MRILVVGTGGVGAAIAEIAASRSFFEELVLADVDVARAERAVATIDDPRRFRSARIDAGDRIDVVTLAREMGTDVIVNACDPRMNPTIFDAAYEAGCTYIDMAAHLSTPDPQLPYERVGVPLGQAQFDASERWADRELLAIVGMGVEPGLSDVFARYARDCLFESIDEIGVRDGSDLRIDGIDFAPTFSIWTTIEECLNPPIVWERDRGWYTTEPFSGLENFTFPEGIGTLECVNVEHEEVLFVPRHIECERVTFKYGLGQDFIDVLETLHRLGLDSTQPVVVNGVPVAPRDVVAAVLPNPANLGHRMHGRTCAGTWVRGVGLDGKRREVYLYQIVDNEETMGVHGHQAVVWQTAINPVIALELLAAGTWKGHGVHVPEAFDPLPYLELLSDYGAPWAIEERNPAD